MAPEPMAPEPMAPEPMATEPMAPKSAGQQYSMEWLLDVLSRRAILDPAVRRDLEVQQAQQRARVAHSKTEAHGGSASGAAARYQVGPGELIASFGLQHPDGGPLDEDRIASVVAPEAGLDYHKIDSLELDMALITRTLSRPFALRHVVIPIASTDHEITVAVEDPFDLEVVEGLKRIVVVPVRRVVSSKRDIIKAITEVYGFRQSVESAARESSVDTISDFEQLVKLRTLGEIEATDAHIVNAVDFLLRYAFDQRASDIHIEAKKGDTRVRLRIDGVLHGVHSIPKQVHPAVLSRIKTMARMDIAEKRRPQDGRIKTVMADREVELRVSTLPTAFGEKVVIRIFDPGVLLRDLPDLGFGGTDLETFQRWIALPHGMLLITGPTGSGKTTTLYTTLKTLSDDTVNITTVEDPIEMVTDHFNQVAVQPKLGLDFAGALRAILRQDPDVVMVGEIRDQATAEMAIQAALTGHLVFSTLHTNDSVGAVTRLLDLGVPPFLAGSTLVGVMAQRLMRRICEACKVPAPLTGDQIMALGLEASAAGRLEACARGCGCTTCRGTGFYGRIGIFEMLDIDAELGAHIAAGVDEDALRKEAAERGMRTLRDHAVERLAQGVTTAEEVVRVTGVAPA
ncbi:MAG: GspE/PulE family protein [Myxococcota bacterium]